MQVVGIFFSGYVSRDCKYCLCKYLSSKYIHTPVKLHLYSVCNSNYILQTNGSNETVKKDS